MRALDETETEAVFKKLFTFTGNNLKNIVDNPSHKGPDPNSGRYCFRLHKKQSLLWFGTAARSTQDCRKLDPNAIVVHHQADIDEYLRMEDEL